MSEGREGVPSVQETEESSGVLETELQGETEGVEQTNEPEYKPGESAQETAERLIKETEADVQGNEDPSIEATEADSSKPVKPKSKKSDEDDYDPELIAPERLNAAEKKMFQNLPKGLKRAFQRSIKNLESQGTRSQQQASEIVKKWGQFEQQITPFATEWAQRGISITQGVLQLAAVQKKLSDPNPVVREETYLKLARNSKVDIIKLASKLSGGGSQGGEVQDISSHPQYQELKNEVLSLREQIKPVSSYHKQLIEQQEAQIADQIVSEVEAVRNEKDASSGELKYPKLFESAFLESAKPLVIGLRRADPNLSWGDAYRRVYATLTGQFNLGSSPTVAPRLHASNGNQTSRATTAAVTVRGRTSPSLSTTDLEPPTEVLRKGSQATMDWINQNIGRGG